VITTKKIGRRTEYTESVRHSCGHTIDYVTLGYKMERRQVAQKRQIPCGRCQLGALLKAPGNAQQKFQPDNGYVCNRPGQCAKGQGGKCYSGFDCPDKAIAG